LKCRPRRSFREAEGAAMERRPAIGVHAHARRGSVNDRRHDLVLGPIVVAEGIWGLRRRGTAIGEPGVDRTRQDEPQEPGGREVELVGREPLDRHGDQENTVPRSGRWPVRTCHVRASLSRKDRAPSPFGTGRIIARIRPLARRGRTGYGLFCVNDHECARCLSALPREFDYAFPCRVAGQPSTSPCVISATGAVFRRRKLC
jgi:hypothetical protein